MIKYHQRDMPVQKAPSGMCGTALTLPRTNCMSDALFYSITMEGF